LEVFEGFERWTYRGGYYGKDYFQMDWIVFEPINIYSSAISGRLLTFSKEFLKVTNLESSKLLLFKI